jgi:hypothetical protein
MRYSAYGVCLDSEFPLAGLPAALDESTTVRLLSNRRDASPMPSIYDLRLNYLSISWSERPILRLDDIGEFQLRPKEMTIYCNMSAGARIETTRYWLMNLMLPLHLLLAGRLEFLHGSAVRVGDGAVVFLAASMGGKSTIANYFVECGHSLLTDEYVGLRRDGEFMVVPSAPFIRPRRQIGDLGDPVVRFESNALPLRAIYLLALGEEPAQIIPISGVSAITGIVRHCRFRHPERTKERFTQFAEMASEAPVARLCIPRDISRLPEVRRAVLAQLGERDDSI